jgi:predicted alpha/beta hydrolase
MSQQLRCDDGETLAVSVFSPPPATRSPAVLVVNPAIGNRQERYWDTARYWAARGWRVVTYDYRGIGASAALQRDVGRFRLADWGRQDLTAVLRHVRQAWAPPATVVLAHSMGAQVVQFCAHPEWIDAAVFVAGQKGYWRHWDNAYRHPLQAFWHVMPACVRLFGSFPLMRLAGCETLPRQIALDWARWSRAPGFVDEAGEALAANGARLRCPLLSVSMGDDPLFGPKPAVDALLAWYPNARAERLHLTPATLGTVRIGHAGLFDADTGGRFWPGVLAWLDAKRTAQKIFDCPAHRVAQVAATTASYVPNPV